MRDFFYGVSTYSSNGEVLPINKVDFSVIKKHSQPSFIKQDKGCGPTTVTNYIYIKLCIQNRANFLFGISQLVILFRKEVQTYYFHISILGLFLLYFN